MASRLQKPCCQSSVVHGGAQGKPPVHDARSFADTVVKRLQAVGFEFDLRFRTASWPVGALELNEFEGRRTGRFWLILRPKRKGGTN